MNKDTRYGPGDITFNMNVAWLDHALYELKGYTEKETERESIINDDEYYEDMVKIEEMIGDFIEKSIDRMKTFCDFDYVEYVLNDVVGYRIIEKWYEICD